jgi:uncharacterized protein (DUF2267 family)
VKEHEIVSAVAQSAGISSNEHAEHAVRATLTVLGSRLAGGETSDLGSQLPPALAEALPDSGPGESFGIDEFYRRLADVEGQGCTPEDARQHARAVVAALKVAVTPGEFEDVAGQLPDDYADLLGTGPIKH